MAPKSALPCFGSDFLFSFSRWGCWFRALSASLQMCFVLPAMESAELSPDIQKRASFFHLPVFILNIGEWPSLASLPPRDLDQWRPGFHKQSCSEVLVVGPAQVVLRVDNRLLRYIRFHVLLRFILPCLSRNIIMRGSDLTPVIMEKELHA